MRERLGKGLALWSVCCSPAVPNSFLHSRLNEVRLHGAITALTRMDGFLRWNFTGWPDDPRKSLTFFRGGWPAGDTCFVYPSGGGQCLRSLRFYALRRGIEDYELMKMAGPEAEERALERLFPERDVSKWDYADWNHEKGQFDLSASAFEDARRILTEAIEKKGEIGNAV